ncbi:MAG: hypothetical protein E7214_13370 [Clostridium sp.]|nr:hypothetical protein [Clostridium sp.]
MDKKYYSERNGHIIDKNIDFDRMVKLFVNLFNIMKNEFYFSEAIGDYCENGGEIAGKWGNNIEAFIFSKTHIEDLWPIDVENYLSKDEDEIFSMIEFLYDYVSKPVNIYECGNWYCKGKHCNEYDKEAGQEYFRSEVNSIINFYDDGYFLTKEGEVYKVAASGLEELVNNKILTSDEKNIDDRISSAISQYFRFNSTMADKKAAILSLAGVLEYLQKDGIKLEKKDDNALFEIMNKFDLRHHQKIMQKGEYEKEEWYEWFFYTFLASIRFLLRLHNKIL